MSALDPEALKRAGDVCRKCRAEILWATTRPKGGGEGKAMPIDPELVVGGNIALSVDDAGMLIARHVTPAATIEAYVTHFSTCPAAEYFRGEQRQALDHDEQHAAKLRALQVRMPFGKYGGQTLEEVARHDERYLKWAFENLEWRRTDVRDAIAVVLGRES